MENIEDIIVVAIKELVGHNWTVKRSPLLLSAIIPELKQRNIDFYTSSVGEKLKPFIIRTKNSGNYKLVTSNASGQVGVVPVEAKDSRIFVDLSSREKSSGKNSEVSFQNTQLIVTAEPLRERAPLTLKPRLGGNAATGTVKSSFSHGRSKTVVVEVPRHKSDKSLRQQEQEARQRALQQALADQQRREAAARHPRPVAIDGVPSAFGYKWSQSNKIVLDISSSNIPRFPFPSSKRDHAGRLEASRMLASDLVDDLGKAKFNVRCEYREEMVKYVARLPHEVDSGNVMLADAAARTIRSLFAAESSFLPAPLAAKLKIFLEQHIGLRAFYSELEVFYRDVNTGRLQEPLPLDAVDGVVSAVQAHTPEVFDPSVMSAIDEEAKPPARFLFEEDLLADSDQPVPPPEPYGELDPKKARDFQIAGIINKLWQIFNVGEKVQKATTSWQATYDALAPYVAQVLAWLEHFLDKSPR